MEPLVFDRARNNPTNGDFFFFNSKNDFQPVLHFSMPIQLSIAKLPSDRKNTIGESMSLLFSKAEMASFSPLFQSITWKEFSCTAKIRTTNNVQEDKQQSVVVRVVQPKSFSFSISEYYHPIVGIIHNAKITNNPSSHGAMVIVESATPIRFSIGAVNFSRFEMDARFIKYSGGKEVLSLVDFFEALGAQIDVDHVTPEHLLKIQTFTAPNAFIQFDIATTSVTAMTRDYHLKWFVDKKCGELRLDSLQKSTVPLVAKK